MDWLIWGIAPLGILIGCVMTALPYVRYAKYGADGEVYIFCGVFTAGMSVAILLIDFIKPA